MKYIKNFILFTLIICSGLFFVACNDSNKNDTTPSGYEVSLETAYAVAQDKGYVGTYDEFIEAIKGESGADGKGILSIEKYGSNGLVDTYKITYTDETTSLFTITNGKDGNGISAINKISSSVVDGRNQTKYTILYTNGSSFDFFVADGKDGVDGENGKGIKTIAKTSTSGLVDTYTILFTDDSKTIFSVTNGKDGVDGKDGRGIKVIAKTSTSGLVDTYTITYTDDTITYFNVTNGKDGENGEDGLGITNITTTENKENNSTTINITYGDNEKTVSFDVYNGKNGENGKDGRGIKVIAKTSTSGLVDTYTITYTDNTESTFTVNNGVGVKNAIINNDGKLIIQLTDNRVIDAGMVATTNGVKSIEKTSTNGLEVVYTITYDNGDTTTFTIKNGEDGKDGRGIKEIQKDSVGFTDTYTIKYTDNTTYTFTVTNGQNGLSAYEIYKTYFPDYTKTEYEWILDLVNGELATKQEETLTVTFDSNGGSAVESQTGIKYAGKATKPANPTRTGYEFDGWFYQDEKWSFIGYSVTDNITLTAKWTAVKYKITFNTNGYTEEYDDIELTFEDDLVLPEPVINGHTYVWQINGESVTNGRWSIASDTTIDLVLTAIDYKINYVLNGGTNSSNNLYGYTVEDEIIHLYDATLKHHNFIGWYENALFEGEKTTVIDTLRAEDITLYARFEEKQYAITVDSDGGSVENYTLTIYAGDEYLIETPTKEHFVFDKWIGYTNEEKTEFIEIEQDGVWDYSDVLYIKATYHAIYEIEDSVITGTTRYFDVEDLVIPTQLNGVEITEIGDRAFMDDTQLRTITISNNITTIGVAAFSGCSNVETLTIGENVNCIKDSAFSEFTSLETLNYNAKNGTDYYKMYGVGSKPAMFKHLGKDTDGVVLNIGENVERVPSWLFFAPDATYAINPNITQINYAENCKLEKIGDGTFLGLTSLKTVTIPKSVKQIGYRAFSDLWGLKEIIFNSEELTLVSSESFVNDYGDLREVFAGAGSRTGNVKFVFGKDVKELTENHISMFDNSGYGSPTYIKTIDFSQNNQITTLPSGLFEKLYWIESIVLSSSITAIEENVFYSESETAHLENIYYMGTPEQFAEISVLNETGGNKYFVESDVYYFAEPDDDISNGYINYWYFDENGEIVTWTPEKYTITYYTNGGSLSGSQKTIYTEVDEDYTFEIPTKTGYEFAGWFITNEFEDEITGITKGTSGSFPIYAKWNKIYTYNLYTFAFDASGNQLNNSSIGGTANIVSISNESDEKCSNATSFCIEHKTLTYEATPTENYRLAGVYVNGEYVENTHNTTHGEIDLYSASIVNDTSQNSRISFVFVEDVEITFVNDVGSGCSCRYDNVYTGETYNIVLDEYQTPGQYQEKDILITYEQFGVYKFTLPMGCRLLTAYNNASWYFYNTEMNDFEDAQVLSNSHWFSVIAMKPCYGENTEELAFALGPYSDLYNEIIIREDIKFFDENNQQIIMPSQKPITAPSGMYATIFDAITDENFKNGVLTGDDGYKYEFKGWYIESINPTYYTYCVSLDFYDAERLIPYGNRYAIFVRVIESNEEPFTVSFDSNGGSYVKPQIGLSSGHKAIIPETPTRTGYEFVGWEYQGNIWNFDNNIVTQNITLTAKWEGLKFRVSYEVVGCDDVFEDEIVTFGDDFMLPEPSVEGYMFTATIDDKPVLNGKWNYETDVVIRLELTIINYTITYHLDGGVLSGIQKITYTIVDDYFEFETPTRTGYEFVGWFNSNSFEEEITGITKGSTGDIEVFAKWNMLNYTYQIETVTFDRYGNEDAVNVGGMINSYSINNTNGDVFATENTFNADYSSMKLKLLPNDNYIFVGVYVNGIYVENSYNYLELEFNLLEASVVDGVANNAIVSVMFVPVVNITFVLTEEVPELSFIYKNPYNGATGEYILGLQRFECPVDIEINEYNIYPEGNYYQDTMMIAKFTMTLPLGCEFLFYNEDYDEIRWGVWKEGVDIQNFAPYVISLDDSLSLVAIYVDENIQDIGFVASIEDDNNFVFEELKVLEVYDEDGNKIETNPFDLSDINNENLVDGLFIFEDDIYMFVGWINVVSDNMKYYVSLDYFDENLKIAGKLVATFIKVTNMFIVEE